MNKEILLDDFSKAVVQLGVALTLDADNDVVKAGCIQYFEFCFELAWKTIKSLANEQGVQDCNSPKSALKYAFKNGWIDEDIWLDMLSSRNKMSHTYNAQSAIGVYYKLSSYLAALNHLEEMLKNVD